METVLLKSLTLTLILRNGVLKNEFNKDLGTILMPPEDSFLKLNNIVITGCTNVSLFSIKNDKSQLRYVAFLSVSSITFAKLPNLFLKSITISSCSYHFCSI